MSNDPLISLFLRIEASGIDQVGLHGPTLRRNQGRGVYYPSTALTLHEVLVEPGQLITKQRVGFPKTHFRCLRLEPYLDLQISFHYYLVSR